MLRDSAACCRLGIIGLDGKETQMKFGSRTYYSYEIVALALFCIYGCTPPKDVDGDTEITIRYSAETNDAYLLEM